MEAEEKQALSTEQRETYLSSLLGELRRKDPRNNVFYGIRPTPTDPLRPKLSFESHSGGGQCLERLRRPIGQSPCDREKGSPIRQSSTVLAALLLVLQTRQAL